MSKKSLLTEMRDTQLAIEMIELGARPQVLVVREQHDLRARRHVGQDAGALGPGGVGGAGPEQAGAHRPRPVLRGQARQENEHAVEQAAPRPMLW